MAQFAVAGPLNESDLHDDFGIDPVGAQAREAGGAGERGLRDFERVEFLTELKQQIVVEAGADFSGVDEVGCLVRIERSAPARYRRRF